MSGEVVRVLAPLPTGVVSVASQARSQHGVVVRGGGGGHGITVTSHTTVPAVWLVTASIHVCVWCTMSVMSPPHCHGALPCLTTHRGAFCIIYYLKAKFLLECNGRLLATMYSKINRSER